MWNGVVDAAVAAMIQDSPRKGLRAARGAYSVQGVAGPETTPCPFQVNGGLAVLGSVRDGQYGDGEGTDCGVSR